MKIARVMAAYAVLAAGIAAADNLTLNSWVGRQVMPKENCRVMSGAQVIDERKITLPMTVSEIRDGWLDVGVGFVQAADVVPFESAAEYYTEVIHRNPRSDKAFNQRAAVWHKQGELRKAVADYEASIALDPRDATAYANRATALSGLGEYELAIRDYETVIRLDARSPWGHNGLAWLLATCPQVEFRDGKQALALASEACRRSHDNFYCLGTLAAAYAEAGDFNQAVTVQRRALAASQASEKQDFQRALELYAAKKPFRDVAERISTATHSSAKR